MSEHYLYLSIDLFSLSVPLIASFYPKHSFFKTWQFLFPSLLIVALFFIGWDMYYTKVGVWGFNERYLTGIKVGNLPLEEVLFFFLIPYSSVFIYFTIPYLLPKHPFKKYGQEITITLFLFSLVMSISFYDLLYTIFTFGFLSLFFGYILLKKIDFSNFYFSFLFVLPFFFLTNGVLTGSFIPDEVVWYNDSENLGFRIGTIPFEDIFYGMLLVGLNCLLYDRFRKREVRF